MKYIAIIIIFLGSIGLNAQVLDSLSHIDYQALHGANLNDVWGYVDEQGNEYAIVGTSKGTSIVNVANPAAPFEVFWIPGTESIWRDPCVYGDYAFVTTEAEDGFLVIDLSPLPQSTTLPTTVYTGPLGDPWQSAHTCFVDENGYAYIFGANRGEGGVIILDVHTNPMSPIEVGEFDNWYVHDGFVRNDTMFLAHISDGFFSLVDVSVKSAPVLLGTQTTPNDFTHNAWPTDNGQYVFTTDEVSGAFITAYDISDPSNMVEVDRTQHSPGQGVIPHNVHVLGNYLVTSYYSDGVIVHDATFPYNMIKVGQYDTYPSQTTGFNGCWGVYPFLPSGTILAADITEGLFILSAAFQQAAYLEGTITDASSGALLTGVKAQLVGNDQFDLSKSNGTYATGIATTGNYAVTYSKVGYFSQTIQVMLFQGQLVYQDVQLVPIPPFSLSVNIIDAVSGLPISDAQILLSAELIDHTGISNGIGQEDFTLFYQESYWISVGKWGYFTNCYEQVIDASTGTLTIALQPGYHDEFTFDFGWTVSGTATSGNWERGVPFGTNGGSAPGIDADYDCGMNAYVTGNDAALNPDIDDVDGGFTQLVSPTMDLTSYTNPHLNFSKWFFCLYGNPPDDTLKVIVNNGLTSVVISQTVSDTNFFYQWVPESIRLLDFITPTANMQVIIRVSDNDDNVNITEAGFDYFHISNANVLSTEELAFNRILIYPNPMRDQVIIEGGDAVGQTYTIRSIEGSLMASGSCLEPKTQLNIEKFSSGIYLIECKGQIWKVIKE
jgi:choice-of-anchor B domain-containing protein